MAVDSERFQFQAICFAPVERLRENRCAGPRGGRRPGEVQARTEMKGYREGKTLVYM